MDKKINFRRIAVAFSIAWVLFTLYPRPALLGQSIYRIFYPPVDAHAVQHLVSELPDFQNPAELEKHILAQTPYQYDWQTYNMPWYFPGPEEALQKGTGDCKTRLIVLASTFEALSIPYELHTSPVHIWIHYEGKVESPIENKAAALYMHDGEQFRFQLPLIDWGHGLEMFWEAFWKVMPVERKITLLFGLGYSVILFFYPQSPARKKSSRFIIRKKWSRAEN